MTVVAPIDRLAAILRLDMPAPVSRSTSRMLRIGNLAPGMAPSGCGKRREATRIRGSPNGARHTPSPRSTTPARNRSEQVLGISRNDCSGSIGTGARDQSESVLGISRCAHCMGPNLAQGRHSSEMQRYLEYYRQARSVRDIPFVTLHTQSITKLQPRA